VLINWTFHDTDEMVEHPVCMICDVIPLPAFYNTKFDEKPLVTA
jgi:hypothetical protein